MDQKAIENIRARTEAKLRYAEVHLNELRALPGLGGNDFDRAHQESFLYHLLGAKDAFLLELNIYYGCNLPPDGVSPGKLRNAIEGKNRKCTELVELKQLESDPTSWLSHAKQMRDHSTHVGGVPRAFHVGGQDDGKVWLRNPKTVEEVKRHFVEEFTDWLLQMKDLLEKLRESAIQANRANMPFKPGAQKPCVK